MAERSLAKSCLPQLGELIEENGELNETWDFKCQGEMWENNSGNNNVLWDYREVAFTADGERAEEHRCKWTIRDHSQTAW